MRCAESRLMPLLRHATVALMLVTLAGCGSFSKKGAGTKAPPRKPVAGGTTAVPSKGDPQARFSAAVQLMREKKLPDAEAAFVALANDFPQVLRAADQSRDHLRQVQPP